ncbi:MAG: M24B family metallopeptidase, partial [Alcaligenaceae bacterium]
WVDLSEVLGEMRLIKDTAELATMRAAAAISAQGHVRAMQAARPGLHEYELEAELLYHFRKHGAQSVAYDSIVAAGANACVLHHRAGNAIMRDGDLVLIDAGCELDGYASDITRTFPANGRFSGPQRALYEIVLAAQQAAQAKTSPAHHWNAGHEAAVQILTQGLLDEGLLKGTLAESLESGAYRRFYMHRTGHWLGMDVHDVGGYRSPPASDQERPWRELQPGMVLTIEPGLYVRPADDLAEKFWNIGIRIEDDAIVTATGCELITRGVPVAADEIEALMRAR